MLTEKTVIVTGGAQGVGFGIAEAVLEVNGNVAILDLKKESLVAATERLTRNNARYKDRVFSAVVDVTDEKAVKEAFEATTRCFGSLDGLVNNAGAIRLGPNLLASGDDWRFQMEVNVIGMHLCCNQFARMVEKNVSTSAIVNIASNAGKVGYPGMAGYNASKAATISLTRTLSAEWAGLNINVNALCPGGVLTPMLRDVAESVGDRTGENPTDLVKTMVPAQLGRHIEPLEIGRIAVFLLSEHANAIRGQSINADGGDTPY